jgi:diacylglycerol kinase family enzyme
MNSRVLLLINTISGRIRPHRTLRILREELERRGLDYECYASEEVDDLSGRSEAAVREGFTEILVWGGDGTISRVAEPLIGTGIVLTILPGGTGNILARYLNTPKNLRRAVRRMLESPEVRSMDGLEVGERTYFLNVSVGMSSLTITQLKSRAKRLFGLLSYVGGLLVHFFRLEPMDFDVRADGNTSTVRGRELILCNAGFMKTPVAPLFAGSDPFDGKMECYIMTVETAGDFFAMIFDVVSGSLKRAERYLWKTTFSREISISGLPRLPIQADGDKIVPEGLVVRIHPGAVRIRVPRPN